MVDLSPGNPVENSNNTYHDYEDNLACIVMSVDPVCRKYSRHIDIRRHYIHELCLGDLIKLVTLHTNLKVTEKDMFSRFFF